MSYLWLEFLSHLVSAFNSHLLQNESSDCSWQPHLCTGLPWTWCSCPSLLNAGIVDSCHHSQLVFFVFLWFWDGPWLFACQASALPRYIEVLFIGYFSHNYFIILSQKTYILIMCFLSSVPFLAYHVYIRRSTLAQNKLVKLIEETVLLLLLLLVFCLHVCLCERCQIPWSWS